MNKGMLYIISAPSGAGKTSLVKQIVADIDLLTVSISYTTRTMRTGEAEGMDYYFSTPEIFKQMISDHAFLEHAQVFDNFYGTSKKSVENHLEKGIDIILEIDWQGAQQVRKMLPDSVSIFILPPSIEVLHQRLQDRGQDSEETITRRMADAINEMSHFDQFDYIIINDNFDLALSELRSIIISNRLTKQRQQQKFALLLQKLIKFDENPRYC